MYRCIVRLLVLLVSLPFFASLGTAQTSRSVVIGYLSPSFPAPPSAFIEELRSRGYEEGRNLKIEFRSAKGYLEALPKLAAELVGLKVDVLVGATTPPALALMKETGSIPIVFFAVSDPVASGLVKSFASPGANITGANIATEYWEPKLLQLVTETLPGTCCVTLLRNPGNQTAPFIQAIYEKTAKSLSIDLQIIDAANPDRLREALAIPLEGRFKTALLFSPDALFNVTRGQIVEALNRQRLPLFAPYREDAQAGALLSFGPSNVGAFRLAADYVAKILDGVKPSELPVEQPTQFDLVLNYKVAKTLGIDFPRSIVARATELIE